MHTYTFAAGCFLAWAAAESKEIILMPIIVFFFVIFRLCFIWLCWVPKGAGERKILENLRFVYCVQPRDYQVSSLFPICLPPFFAPACGWPS